MAYILKLCKLITLTVRLNPTPPLWIWLQTQMNFEGCSDFTKEMRDAGIYTIERLQLRIDLYILHIALLHTLQLQLLTFIHFHKIPSQPSIFLPYDIHYPDSLLQESCRQVQRAKISLHPSQAIYFLKYVRCAHLYYHIT